MFSPGTQAVPFALPSLTGGRATLVDLLCAGPVVLAFFHTSCPVCQLTLPFLGRIAAGAGLQVVGISQDPAEVTTEFVEAFRLTFPVLVDTPGYVASSSYRIVNVPTIIVVETDGLVSNAFTGFSKADLEALGKRAGTGVFQETDRVPLFRPG